ncbi:MAG: ABC transporter ATP-binding protein [Candidatus Gygaella obscura]|nr:ABC transporter ATP-binding protein [Candidatus Gygaella obscura]
MIELINIEKSFGAHRVLNGASLKIKKGETKVIIGRSGCGKSVLLKHIVGILKPNNGEVLVGGTNVARLGAKELNQVRKKIGMVFQGGALFDSLNVAENVGFSYFEHTKMSRDEIIKKVEDSLSLVELYGIGALMPSELSGGMKKRVSLARAICSRPEIILYDEPTTGVDPITAAAINELIKNLHDKLQVTSIVVTHDMTSAYYVADSIAMLYQGKIIAEGTPTEIQNTDHPVVKQFITGAAEGPITESTDTDYP